MIVKQLKSLSRKKRILWWLVGILLFAIAVYFLVADGSGNNDFSPKENTPVIIPSIPAPKEGQPGGETEPFEKPASAVAFKKGNPDDGKRPEQQNVGQASEAQGLEPEEAAAFENERKNVMKPETALNTEGGAQESSPEDGVPDPAEENSSELETGDMFGNEIKSFASPETFILSLPENLYTVQLMGADERAYLIDAARSYNIGSETVCFQKKNGSATWYVLIYRLFTDRSEAEDCVESLDPEIKSNGPWIRTIGDIQREIAERGI